MIVTRAMYHDSRAVAQQCTNGSLGLGLGSVPGQVRGGITTRAAAAQREADPSAHARGGAAALDGGGHLGKAGHAEERQGELTGARLPGGEQLEAPDDVRCVAQLYAGLEPAVAAIGSIPVSFIGSTVRILDSSLDLVLLPR